MNDRLNSFVVFDAHECGLDIYEESHGYFILRDGTKLRIEHGAVYDK